MQQVFRAAKQVKPGQRGKPGKSISGKRKIGMLRRLGKPVKERPLASRN